MQTKLSVSTIIAAVLIGASVLLGCALFFREYVPGYGGESSRDLPSIEEREAILRALAETSAATSAVSGATTSRAPMEEKTSVLNSMRGVQSNPATETSEAQTAKTPPPESTAPAQTDAQLNAKLDLLKAMGSSQ